MALARCADANRSRRTDIGNVGKVKAQVGADHIAPALDIVFAETFAGIARAPEEGIFATLYEAAILFVDRRVVDRQAVDDARAVQRDQAECAGAAGENFLAGQSGFGNVFDPCAVPVEAFNPLAGGYNPALDTREPFVLENCRREGRDPTRVGIDQNGLGDPNNPASIAYFNQRVGDRVELRGFGAFSVRKREARTGRNPSTGATIQIAASKKLTFAPAKALKDALNK
mgnify:CR=1 FL=1